MLAAERLEEKNKRLFRTYGGGREAEREHNEAEELQSEEGGGRPEGISILLLLYSGAGKEGEQRRGKEGTREKMKKILSGMWAGSFLPKLRSAQFLEALAACSSLSLSSTHYSFLL